MERKGSQSKRAEKKKKGKGQQTKLRTVNGKKKKSKFWIMRMLGIEILLNFVRNPRKISPFGKKKKLS